MNYKNGCLICGAKIIYKKSFETECSLCHKRFEAENECENNHFICDDCHRAGISTFTDVLRESKEKSPVELFDKLMLLDGVHMHGPEHHIMIPCILLTSYRNCGGVINIEEAFSTALKRSKAVPGGTCGYWGVCGAAVGAGIYASIVTESDPLNEKEWYKSQELVAKTGERIAKIKGVRCCKRVSFIAFEEAALWTKEYLGISIGTEKTPCKYNMYNYECLKDVCPYYREE